MIVKQVGKNFEPEIIERIEYFSDDYLIEADILIIDLDGIRTEIVGLMPYQGKTNSLSKANFDKIQKKILERQEQINEYLNKGGNLFVLPLKNTSEEIEIFDESKVIDTVKFDYLSTVCLNTEYFSIKSQRGSAILFNEKFSAFFSQFDNSYDFIFTKHTGYVIGKVAKSGQPTSLRIDVGKGHIFLLQNLKTFAEDYSEYYEKQRKCKKAFIELNQMLSVKVAKDENQIEIPEWVNEYLLSNEEDEINNLKLLDKQLQLIENQIAQQKVSLKYYTNLKRLLFSTGTDLEQIVENVFREIGYSVKPTAEFRDDLILSYNEQVAVIEVKGVKGSAAERYAAQLMKWVSTYHSENDINPKGILIVNSFKDKPLKDRLEETFPNQMLPYSERQEFCLITSIQLLELYLDFKDKVLSFEKINELLFKTIGVLKYDSKNKINELPS